MRIPPARTHTLEDVAARAGVSRATASRVVSGGAKVAPATRRAVERAVEALGYVPNRAARSLAGRSSETVALVVSEPSARMFGDPFFAGVTRAIAAALGATRYQLVLLMAQDDRDRERVERHLLRGGADGVLLLSVRAEDPTPRRLADAGIACVLAGRPPEDKDDLAVGYVDADNAGGAQRAVEHLLERGCKVVGTVAGPADMAPGHDRLVGWRDALQAAGRRHPKTLTAYGDFSLAGGRTATAALLRRHSDVDGIFVASDLMALGALEALRNAGRGVPADVAVVGFDDSDLAQSTDPPLTTVRQPIDELGQQMVDALLAQLAGEPPSGTILETELVIRESA